MERASTTIDRAVRGVCLVFIVKTFAMLAAVLQDQLIGVFRVEFRFFTFSGGHRAMQGVSLVLSFELAAMSAGVKQVLLVLGQLFGGHAQFLVGSRGRCLNDHCQFHT